MVNFFKSVALYFSLAQVLMSKRLFNWLTSRGAGVLLHPTSLPGPAGIGTLGQEARRYVDFLADTGMRCWQICPLGPTGFGNSPYQCFSAFAGNPYLIDVTGFVAAGLLTESDLFALHGLPGGFVDYGAQWHSRWKILRTAFDNFSKRGQAADQEEFAKFRKANRAWLGPYTLFMALKNQFDGISWQEWPEEFRRYRTLTKRSVSRQLAKEASAHAFYQFEFSKQWSSLKRYANERQIQIFGDIPIFAAMDSADVWAHPELFQMDENLKPTGIAGNPPDYFSADGQVWGNPLYDWPRHSADNFSWWQSRLQASFPLYDVIRIDHFRGFDEYCNIPPNAANARVHKWEPGPGLKFFEIIRKRFPDAKLVAEDLGINITDSVRRLVADTGLPGMKVLQFGFEGQVEYLPHNTIPVSVLYPGTHDNDTAWGWFRTQSHGVKQFLKRYLRVSGDDVAWDLIRAGYASASRIFVAPMQDFLNLGSEARMNTPGTPSGNWCWRFTSGQLDDLWKNRGEELREYAKLYER
jgi:4-alpha-glucanotransferase